MLNMKVFSTNDIVLVCGATSSVGYDLVKLLDSLGAKVIAHGRNLDILEKLQDECSNNVYIEQKIFNIENEQDINEWMIMLSVKYGKLKSMVSTIGIIKSQAFIFFSIKSIREMLDNNYYINMLLAKAFIQKKNINNNDNSIVFVSSLASHGIYSMKISYSASKIALSHSSKIMAKELARYKIRVNCVSPATLVDSNMFKLNIENKESIDLKEYPLGMPEVRDVSNMCAYLMSPMAKKITGEDIVIDGGFSL